jgi:hypothetical protein
MTPTKFVPYEMKTSVISVYSYEDKTMKGTVSNPYFAEPVAFENLMQLILLIDELQDSLSFPMESMRARSFVTPESDAPPKTAAHVAGAASANPPLATFKINIMFRQNASWQGGIVWLENSTESQFRSLLELVMLFDNALTQSGAHR